MILFDLGGVIVGEDMGGGGGGGGGGVMVGEDSLEGGRCHSRGWRHLGVS